VSEKVADIPLFAKSRQEIKRASVYQKTSYLKQSQESEHHRGYSELSDYYCMLPFVESLALSTHPILVVEVTTASRAAC
jgi:hypothetical protein